MTIGWNDQFEAFLQDYQQYLDEFPEMGWHEKMLRNFHENLPLVLAGDRGIAASSPFFRLHAAIMLMLDARKKLTPFQRRKCKGLTVRWIRLERSARTKPVGEGHRIEYDPSIYEIGQND